MTHRMLSAAPSRRRRAWKAGIPVAAALLALTGCASGTPAGGTAAATSGSAKLAPLTVDMSFPYAASQWNCLYDYGIKKGFYAKYGTAPKFDALNGSVALINEVATGSVDIGVSAAAANVIQAVSKNAPVKLVAVQENDSPNAVISLAGKPIKEPKDVIGKKIAYSPTSLNGISFDLLLQKNDIPKSDVTVVGVQPAAYAGSLVSGAIDGYVSYPSSSIPNVEKAGGKPVTMLLRDFGVNPTPADGYISNDTFIKSHGTDITNFLKGARDTWLYLDKHQGEAQAAGEYCAKSHVGVDPATAAKQIALVLQVNKAFLSSPDFMSIDSKGLAAQIDMLKNAGQLSNPLPASSYYTSALLPKK